ncbi:LysR family transcriptional regulator [Lactobacillus halodurans]|uniref:LysR family transcriptional regulator n=1 Tax=Companilactobacillus halodurans TaxID=2584183 RepID=A0A5P0ZZN7_9LACO|nr:LysR family transcriptional regulator [Companilactobacillus halodurans]MQS98427.1 LysR family transcriptional regulator [Companilactobacillus halodurans]
MIQQMRYFVSIVKNHSFTNAAIECNISQSSISEQMKNLSNELEVKLIKRKGRSFELTKAGEFFYQHCQEVLNEYDKLIADTRLVEKNTDNEFVLRLGYLRKFGSQEFLKAVAQFSDKYPKVTVKIHSGSYQELFKLLLNDKLDLNFSDSRNTLINTYENLPLTQAEYRVILSPKMFPDRKESIDTKDLVDLPCILVVGADQFESEQEYYRNILGIKSPFKIAQTFGEAQMLGATGQGYIVVNSRTSGQIDSKINRVLKLTNNGRDLMQHYYAYWKKDNSSFYIESLAKILKDQFKK